MPKCTNLMEAIVEERLDELYPTLDCCQCNSCRNDVLALALNHLEPRYVSTNFGGLMVKLENARLQYEMDVLTAIMNAVRVVSECPRHDSTV